MKNVKINSGVLALLLGARALGISDGSAFPIAENDNGRDNVQYVAAGMGNVHYNLRNTYPMGYMFDRNDGEGFDLRKRTSGVAIDAVRPFKVAPVANATANPAPVDAGAPVPEIELEAIAARADGKDVVYTMSDSSQYKLVGGTRAWRNNNPGNLRGDEEAIGKAGGFAVFANDSIGRAALGRLLMSDTYRNLTIAAAIRKYAPPIENNPAAYARKLQKLTGLNISRRLRDLNAAELAKCIAAICVLEGWREGQKVRVARENVVLAANGRSR